MHEQLPVRPSVITRFLGAGHHASWVTGDEVYSCNPSLRVTLETGGTGHVLAVARHHEPTTQAGKSPAGALAKKSPKEVWQKLLAEVRARAQGQRFHVWGHIDPPSTPPAAATC